MAKQRSTQSRGSGKAGAKTTTVQGLERMLEPLMLVLDDQALDTITAGSDALAQILWIGNLSPEQMVALAGAEDVLDQIERALEPAREAIKVSLASK
jgi:hypothetical protein